MWKRHHGMRACFRGGMCWRIEGRPGQQDQALSPHYHLMFEHRPQERPFELLPVQTVPKHLWFTPKLGLFVFLSASRTITRSPGIPQLGGSLVCIVWASVQLDVEWKCKLGQKVSVKCCSKITAFLMKEIMNGKQVSSNVNLDKTDPIRLRGNECSFHKQFLM